MKGHARITWPVIYSTCALYMIVEGGKYCIFFGLHQVVASNYLKKKLFLTKSSSLLAKICSVDSFHLFSSGDLLHKSVLEVANRPTSCKRRTGARLCCWPSLLESVRTLIASSLLTYTNWFCCLRGIRSSFFLCWCRNFSCMLWQNKKGLLWGLRRVMLYLSPLYFSGWQMTEWWMALRNLALFCLVSSY